MRISRLSCQSRPYLCVTTHDAFRQNAIFLLPSAGSSPRRHITSGTGNPRLSNGLRAWKIPQKTKPRRAKLGLLLKMRVQEPTTHETEQTVQKKKFLCINWNQVEGWGQETVNTWRRNKWTAIALPPLYFLFASLCGVVTASISCLKFQACPI